MRNFSWALVLRSFVGISGAVSAGAIACVLNANGAGASERDGTRAAMSFAVRAAARVSYGRTTSSIDPFSARALATGAQPVVYVSASAAGTVLAYPTGTATAPTAPIETIAGLSFPTALAVDSAGNLYVVEHRHRDIEVFAPGSVIASRTLLPAPSDNIDCIAVDAHGTVYAGVPFVGIRVFAGGSTVPTSTLSDPLLVIPESIAIDGGGNVFVHYVQLQGADQIGVFTTTSSVGFGFFANVYLGPPPQPGNSVRSDIAADKNGDIVASYSNGVSGDLLRVYPPKQLFPSAGFTLHSTGSLFALTAGNHHVFVTSQTAAELDEYAFPGGGLQQHIVLPASFYNGAAGIATAPASPVGMW